jgi:hypothetical protein
MLKTKKCLILYQTMTGNTEKVALRFKKAFDKKGWQCAMVKVEKKIDIDNPPFDFRDYDFLCAGSGVYGALPGKFISDFLFKFSHRGTEREERERKVRRDRKIVPGPKTGVVFVTYAGAHLGPKEAEPALSLLELDIEHLKFKCIGRFCCPGRWGKSPTPRYWHGDITHRPSERDLQKAEIFMEEKIEEIQ